MADPFVPLFSTRHSTKPGTKCQLAVRTHTSGDWLENWQSQTTDIMFLRGMRPNAPVTQSAAVIPRTTRTLKVQSAYPSLKRNQRQTFDSTAECLHGAASQLHFYHKSSGVLINTPLLHGWRPPSLDREPPPPTLTDSLIPCAGLGSMAPVSVAWVLTVYIATHGLFYFTHTPCPTLLRSH